MARFMIRVELHGASPADYRKLAECLARKNIFDIIQGSNAWYTLPPGEYWYEADVGLEDVLKAVQACAASVSASYAVVVTEAGDVRWSGLEKVKH